LLRIAASADSLSANFHDANILIRKSFIHFLKSQEPIPVQITDTPLQKTDIADCLTGL